MKIKVKSVVPVRSSFCPKVGEIYNVLRLFQSSLKDKVFYIRVNGAVVGVREQECEVIEE